MDEKRLASVWLLCSQDLEPEALPPYPCAGRTLHFSRVRSAAVFFGVGGYGGFPSREPSKHNFGLRIESWQAMANLYFKPDHQNLGPVHNLNNNA